MPLDMSLHSRHRRRLVPRLSVALLAGLLSPGARPQPIELSFGVASATVQRGIALGVGGVDAHATAHYAHPASNMG